jgi:uncharacterized protein
MSQQNVQAIRRLYEAFNAGDLDTFERGLSPDILWNEAENSLYDAGNPYRSFSAIRDGIFRPTARDFDNFRCDPEKLLDAGDFVVGTGRYRGRNKETGKLLSAQFCHVLHLDPQGRVDALQEYADTLQEAEVSGRTDQPMTEELKIPHPAI